MHWIYRHRALSHGYPVPLTCVWYYDCADSPAHAAPPWGRRRWLPHVNRQWSGHATDHDMNLQAEGQWEIKPWETKIQSFHSFPIYTQQSQVFPQITFFLSEYQGWAYKETIIYRTHFRRTIIHRGPFSQDRSQVQSSEVSDIFSLTSTHAWKTSGEWFSTLLDGPIFTWLLWQHFCVTSYALPYRWSNIYMVALTTLLCNFLSSSF